MSLTVQQVEALMEKIAPAGLKESYDNVGLMVGDRNLEVTSILVALDCTLDVIEEAVTKKCNLIITHHPLLFIKPESITEDSLLGKKIIKLIKNDISVFSSHTNLDIAGGGLNDTITQLLGFKEWSVIEPVNEGSNTLNGINKSLGVGRMVIIDNPLSLGELCSRVKRLLNISKLRFSGSEDMLIRKLAIINGSGEDYFRSSYKQGADCILTGDTTYHYVSDYVEMGVAIIDAGHFETEWPAMKIVANYISEEFKKLGYKNNVIISEQCKSPYKFV